ncbi:cytochrome P450 [Rhodopila sp.]|uniref:cytochrome P450 n=1 Tax=Rhodopila sp. TaxID=2480087 RepID=UPI003D109F66
MSLFGFLRAVRTNPLTIWPRAAYEQDTSVRTFLGRTTVLLNAPEAIHHVLVGNPGNYRRTPATIRILRPITGKGLLLSEGDDWKLQRRTIAPALAPRVMPMLAGHVVTATDDLLNRLPTDTPIDLLATMQFLALDIAGRSMFSLEMQQYGIAMRRLITEYSQRFARPHLLDMVLPPRLPTLRDLGRAGFKKRWMGLVETMIAARSRMPMPDTPRDLFDLLRSARDPDTGAGFSPEQLRDQVATLILAGHETTAVTLFWALIMLAQAPEEQTRVAEEAAGVTIKSDTAHAVVASLVRTRAAINETLRLFPPAFTMARQAITADRAGEVDLPAGTLVLIAPWVLHRHHALWRDPDVFDPSRFLPDAPPPPRFAFMPFGAGPRVCVGAQFAMTEAVLVLAALIRRFDVAREDSRPILPVAIVTTQPDHPALVRLTARTERRK